MTIFPIDDAQRTAARLAGIAYLLAIPLALFAELYVLNQIVVSGNATETARNIVAHERLFRLGTAANLGVFALDAVLIAALFRVLQPIDRTLALVAAFWRLIETAVLVTAALHDLDALRVLSGIDYLRAFDGGQLDALARLSLGAHGAGYNAGLLFAGLGSTVFCYLWLKSNYVPSWLAAFGIFASALLAGCSCAFIVFPELAKTVTVAYFGGPIFMFELTMGFWLVSKGIAPSRTPKPEKTKGLPMASP